MVKRYPHTCTIFYSSMVQNEDGDFIDNGKIEIPLPCRIEPASPDLVENDGGMERKASEIVYTPLFDSSLIEGEPQIQYRNKIKKIIRLESYQTHVEIWVE